MNLRLLKVAKQKLDKELTTGIEVLNARDKKILEEYIENFPVQLLCQHCFRKRGTRFIVEKTGRKAICQTCYNKYSFTLLDKFCKDKGIDTKINFQDIPEDEYPDVEQFLMEEIFKLL